MTARLERQPLCRVCGTDRQMRECKPGWRVGPIEPCRACAGPSPLPVLAVPFRRDVPRGGVA